MGVLVCYFCVTILKAIYIKLSVTRVVGKPDQTLNGRFLLKRQILYLPELTAPLDSKVRENLLNCQAKYKAPRLIISP